MRDIFEKTRQFTRAKEAMGMGIRTSYMATHTVEHLDLIPDAARL